MVRGVGLAAGLGSGAVAVLAGAEECDLAERVDAAGDNGGGASGFFFFPSGDEGGAADEPDSAGFRAAASSAKLSFSTDASVLRVRGSSSVDEEVPA